MSLKISGVPLDNRSIGPSCTYHFLRGLTLSFRGLNAILSGGQTHTQSYPFDSESLLEGVPNPSAYLTMINKIENLTQCRLVAMSGNLVSACDNNGKMESTLSDVELPPEYGLYLTENGIVSDADLGEALLFELNTVEKYCRLLITNGGKDEKKFGSAYETVLYLQDLIKNGQLDNTQLNKYIGSRLPKIKEAFFLLHTIEIGESFRSALLRASYHSVRMAEKVWQTNMRPTSNSLIQSKEHIVMTPDIDRIADEYTSAVLSSYSALDMLYEYFIFLTRQPFGDPHYPSNFHFPDKSPSSAFCNGGLPRPDDINSAILPFAIPNLSNNAFRNLRILRNDLVHNMAADGHRPIAFVGIGLPPVGGLPIQYVQYLTRDVKADGTPVTITWNRRFYSQQRDAQLALYEHIEQVWQCCFDTTKWLSQRLRHIGYDQGFTSSNI